MSCRGQASRLVLSLLIGGSEADPAFVDELSAELDAVV